MTWLLDGINRMIKFETERALKDYVLSDGFQRRFGATVHRVIEKVYDETPDDRILSLHGFRIFLATAIRRKWPDYPEASLRADIACITEGMDAEDGWDMSAGAARELAREHIAEYSE